jgi:hypothetical protein
MIDDTMTLRVGEGCVQPGREALDKRPALVAALQQAGRQAGGGGNGGSGAAVGGPVGGKQCRQGGPGPGRLAGRRQTAGLAVMGSASAAPPMAAA